METIDEWDNQKHDHASRMEFINHTLNSRSKSLIVIFQTLNFRIHLQKTATKKQILNFFFRIQFVNYQLYWINMIKPLVMLLMWKRGMYAMWKKHHIKQCLWIEVFDKLFMILQYFNHLIISSWSFHVSHTLWLSLISQRKYKIFCTSHLYSTLKKLLNCYISLLCFSLLYKLRTVIVVSILHIQKRKAQLRPNRISR